MNHNDTLRAALWLGMWGGVALVGAMQLILELGWERAALLLLPFLFGLSIALWESAS